MDFNLIDLRPQVDICNICPLANRIQDIKHVPGEIVGDNPRVLFIAESPGFSGIELGRPLIGSSGSLLREFIQTILSSFILYNIILCHPRSGGIRTPLEDERNHCKQHVDYLIKTYNPELVVLLGDSAAKALIPTIKKTLAVSTLIRNSPYIIDGIMYIVSYHPSYILRQGGVESKEWGKWATNLRRYLHPFQNVNSVVTELNVTEPEDDIKYSIHSPEDLPKILSVLRTIDGPVAMDFEARTVNPWEECNMPTGFSLVFTTGEKSGRGFFISLIDRQLNEGEIREIISFLKNKPVITYNCKYEMGMVHHWWGELILLEDAYSLCKIHGCAGSLKDNARLLLNKEVAWEDPIKNLVSLFDKFFLVLKEFCNDYPKHGELLRSGNLVAWRSLIIENKDLQKNKTYDKMIKALDLIEEKLSTEDEIHALRNYPYSYASIPILVLSKYCISDGYWTLRLWEKLWTKQAGRTL